MATGARPCAPTTNRRNHNGGVSCGWRFLSGRGETSSTLPDLRRTVVSRGALRTSSRTASTTRSRVQTLASRSMRCSQGVGDPARGGAGHGQQAVARRRPGLDATFPTDRACCTNPAGCTKVMIDRAARAAWGCRNGAGDERIGGRWPVRSVPRGGCVPKRTPVTLKHTPPAVHRSARRFPTSDGHPSLSNLANDPNSPTVTQHPHNGGVDACMALLVRPLVGRVCMRRLAALI